MQLGPWSKSGGLCAASAVALVAVPILLMGQTPARVSSRATLSHTLIFGVPFISWSEAANLQYRDKNVVNPSLPASEGMILEYWGRDLASLSGSEQTLPGWVHQGGNGGSLDSLKELVARRIPVVVCLAMTPIAHNPGPAAAAVMAMTDSGTGETLRRGNATSGVLGPMIALDTLRRWGEVLRPELMRESVLMACRVVIGYDDARQVVVLHDPSFGPAWEVSYQDFDTMWAFWNRLFMATYPSDFARLLAKPSAGQPYPPRTAEQRAAEAFVYGYALASVGRRNDAEARLTEGLAIPGLPTGYRQSMLLELARLADARHETAAAITKYQQAGVLVPQDPRVWRFLGELMQRDGRAASRQVADSLLRRAAALCADTTAQEAARRALPHDYSTMDGCQQSAAPPPTARLAAGEIGFAMPGPGWTQTEAEVLTLVRVETPGRRAQAVSVWPVDVPDGLRGLPQEVHVREYFAMERGNPRDVPWSGFVEATRDIAHRRYPTLSAQITGSASKPAREVLFVLVFPDDFSVRQRFYVVMWNDYHRPHEPGASLKALDAFVASLGIATASEQ